MICPTSGPAIQINDFWSNAKERCREKPAKNLKKDRKVTPEVPT
jgi:hypothetical protein